VYESVARDRPVVPDDLRLLLVEDDDGDAFLVDELLREGGGGLTTARARTMKEGLELLGHEEFSCVLLDLGLPDGEGLDVVRRYLEAADVAVV